jgi:hypothetical protein
MPDSKAKYRKPFLINPILNEELWRRCVFKKYDKIENPKKQYLN